MRLQLTIGLAAFAIGCGPPNEGVTFLEPDTASAMEDGSGDSGSSGGGQTSMPTATQSASNTGMTAGTATSPTTDPSTTGMTDGTSNVSDGSSESTGPPLPQPVTMVEWTVGTNSYAGFFATANIIAVWIEDDQGNFVRTLMQLSEIETVHLVEWNLQTGGNEVDAITGATPENHQVVHGATWNLQDVNQQVVPDGDYVLRIEMTEDNSAGMMPLGPTYSIPFTLGTGHFDIQPANGNIFHTLRAFGHD